MSDFTVVTRMQLNQAVERILHVPGNYNGGILEMTIVVDMKGEPETCKEVLMNVAKSLKQHSEVFRNVRLNVVKWIGDTGMVNEVVPLISLTTSSFYEEFFEPVQKDEKKHISFLMDYLKKFHARSKLILIVTEGRYQKDVDEEDSKRLQQALLPFLGKKFARVLYTDETVTIENRKI